MSFWTHLERRVTRAIAWRCVALVAAGMAGLMGYLVQVLL